MTSTNAMPSLLLGVDCGLTVTKAVLYADDGSERGAAAVRTPHTSPRPRWVERDMQAVWQDCATVVRSALRSAGASGGDVAAVGVTGHGDGLYLVDAHDRPVRPGILSTDSRAVDVLDGIAADGRIEKILHVTGQIPFPGSSVALLAWAAANEPKSLDRARQILACKDWIKLNLTGSLSTDPTEASSIFTDVHTQQYSRTALELLKLDGLWDRLPPVIPSAEVAGRVNALASELTGLAEGTPVVSGLHDIDACAVGVGSGHSGQLTMIAGSYSINETTSAEPRVDERWACRNFVHPGEWMQASSSPASASNLEWFASEICGAASVDAGGPGELIFERIEREVEAALQRPREICYLPFLYGSPFDNKASAAFIGLRGWHSRADLARAVYEGVVLNHLWHVRALATAFTLEEARLTGGGSKSTIWSQMFADAIGMPVITTSVAESGALGSAMCAGIGIGRYAGFDEAADRFVRVKRTYDPNPRGQASFAEAEGAFRSLVSGLIPFWRGLTDEGRSR